MIKNALAQSDKHGPWQKNPWSSGKRGAAEIIWDTAKESEQVWQSLTFWNTQDENVSAQTK